MTLLQQWARQYTEMSQSPGSPRKRARAHQFFSSGVDNLLLVTDAVPTLLHLSVLLFFAGLLILLRDINHTLFNVVVAWVVLPVTSYLYITILPFIRPTSPHYTPLSSLAWQFVNFELKFLTKLLPRISSLHYLAKHRPTRLSSRLQEKAEKVISRHSPKVDIRILESLFDTLSEDGAKEKLFEVIPGFFNSQMVDERFIKDHLSSNFITNFRRSISQFLEQTVSSDTVPELVKSRRLLTCLNATHTVLGGRAGMGIVAQIIRSENWNAVPLSPEMGHILIRLRTSTDFLKAITGSCVIARIIASPGRHDDTWMTLAGSQLELTNKVLKEYLHSGDSVFLANLIRLTRLFFEKGLQFGGILQSISEFNVRDALRELQEDFCTLWNEIVDKSRYSSEYTFILQEIRPVYDALHSGPPAPTNVDHDSWHLGPHYPLCPDPQTHFLNAPDSATFHKFTTSPTNEDSSSVHIDMSHVPQQAGPVASSSSSPLRGRPLSRSHQHIKTDIYPTVLLDVPSFPYPLTPLSEPTASLDVRSHTSDMTKHSHLTTSGKDVSSEDPPERRNYLHVAAETGYINFARSLLDSGTDVNVTERNLRTPLHLAANHGKLAVAQLLLERGADVDARDEMDWTPLHFAAQQGHPELVRLLLENHADVLVLNREDHTFLDVAWARKHIKIVDDNAQYEGGQTALHIAAQHGDPALMVRLIHREVDPIDPNVEDEDQETPLFPASRNGKVEAAELLLKAGADANHRDWQKMTPLHGASENGHDDVARLLLECEADVNTKHENDWTALHLASRAGKGKVAEVLLDHGAKVDEKNDSEWTPLHMASQKGHLDVVKLLLTAGANVNILNEEDETPLHLAAFYSHFKVAQVLIEHGADLQIKNKEGRVPGDLESKEGKTLLDLALEGRDDNMARMLRLVSVGGIPMGKPVEEHPVEEQLEEQQGRERVKIFG